MWRIVKAEITYNWLKFLLAIILMIIPINIIREVYHPDMIATVDKEFTSDSLRRVTAVLMFMGYLMTLIATHTVIFNRTRNCHTRINIFNSITPGRIAVAHLMVFYSVHLVNFVMWFGVLKGNLPDISISQFHLYISITACFITYQLALGILLDVARYSTILKKTIRIIILIIAAVFLTDMIFNFTNTRFIIKPMLKWIWSPIGIYIYVTSAILATMGYVVSFHFRKSFVRG